MPGVIIYFSGLFQIFCYNKTCDMDSVILQERPHWFSQVPLSIQIYLIITVAKVQYLFKNIPWCHTIKYAPSTFSTISLMLQISYNTGRRGSGLCKGPAKICRRRKIEGRVVLPYDFSDIFEITGNEKIEAVQICVPRFVICKHLIYPGTRIFAIHEWLYHSVIFIHSLYLCHMVDKRYFT